MEKGMFITFEGGEGCGKSTQLTLTAKYLREKGYKVKETREPGGTPTAEKIRELILHPIEGKLSIEAELLLFMSARAEHVNTVIRPSIENGYIVLCDRFSDSTYAYQGVNGKIPYKTMEKLNHFATNGLTPNLTFFLDGDPKALLERRNARGTKDRFEAKDLAFHEAVKKEFDKLTTMFPARIVKINALQDVYKVQHDICKILTEFGI